MSRFVLTFHDCDVSVLARRRHAPERRSEHGTLAEAAASFKAEARATRLSAHRMGHVLAPNGAAYLVDSRGEVYSVHSTGKPLRKKETPR